MMQKLSEIVSYFSLNIQVVARADLKMFDIVARWPGSSHDSTVFNNSRLRAKMENGNSPNSILLGDSGYPLRSYFLTPLADLRTAAEQLYNEAHIRTRNTVKRLFGNWKRRFPVLAYGLRLKLDTILAVIIGTAVLQNIAREMHNLEPPQLAEGINVGVLNDHIRNGDIPYLADNNNLNMNNFRQNLIENYFNNL